MHKHINAHSVSTPHLYIRSQISGQRKILDSCRQCSPLPPSKHQVSEYLFEVRCFFWQHVVTQLYTSYMLVFHLICHPSLYQHFILNKSLNRKIKIQHPTIITCNPWKKKVDSTDQVQENVSYQKQILGVHYELKWHGRKTCYHVFTAL